MHRRRGAPVLPPSSSRLTTSLWSPWPVRAYRRLEPTTAGRQPPGEVRMDRTKTGSRAGTAGNRSTTADRALRRPSHDRRAGAERFLPVLLAAGLAVAAGLGPLASFASAVSPHPAPPGQLKKPSPPPAATPTPTPRPTAAPTPEPTPRSTPMATARPTASPTPRASAVLASSPNPTPALAAPATVSSGGSSSVHPAGGTTSGDPLVIAHPIIPDAVAAVSGPAPRSPRPVSPTEPLLAAGLAIAIGLGLCVVVAGRRRRASTLAAAATVASSGRGVVPSAGSSAMAEVGLSPSDDIDAFLASLNESRGSRAGDGRATLIADATGWHEAAAASGPSASLWVRRLDKSIRIRPAFDNLPTASETRPD